LLAANKHLSRSYLYTLEIKENIQQTVKKKKKPERKQEE
jgi:hypothetical protein